MDLVVSWLNVQGEREGTRLEEPQRTTKHRSAVLNTVTVTVFPG